MHSLLSTECYEQLGVNKVDVAGSGCDDCIPILIQKNSMITDHCFHWIFERGLHAVALGASFGCLLMPAVFGKCSDGCMALLTASARCSSVHGSSLSTRKGVMAATLIAADEVGAEC